MTAQNQAAPHSDGLERATLAAMLHFADHLEVAVRGLSAEDFYTPRNAELFAVLSRLHATGGGVDPVVARSACELRPNALELLVGLEADLRIAADIEPWCNRLRQLATARRLMRASMSVAAAALDSSRDPESFLDQATADLTAALQTRSGGSQRQTALEVIQECIGDVTENVAGKAPRRQRTGIETVDSRLGGLEDGRLYIVAGRPGMGKTAWAMQAGESVAGDGGRVGVFSLEMPAAEVMSRMLAQRVGVPARALQHRGGLTPDQMRKLLGAAEAVAQQPLVFLGKPRMTIEEIARAARQEKLRHGLDLVVIDYLQLIVRSATARRDQREDQDIGDATRECKLMARELQLPVVLLSQLNREVEKRNDKRPLMSDLRGSGAIEQDADTILLLYRDDYYNANSLEPGVCEVIVGKQRGGQTGTIKVGFEAALTRFYDRGDL